MKKYDHFLSVGDVSAEWIGHIFKLTKEVKDKLKKGVDYLPLKGKTVAMIFQKPSARTRISFETGTYRLGGHALYLAPQDIGIGKRESTSDIGEVLSRFNDCIMARLFGHEMILELAEASSVPVINGLTDLLHPCQILADTFTVLEHKKTLEDIKVAYVSDGNNVCNSWINFAGKMPINLSIATPKGFEPDQGLLDLARKTSPGKIELTNDPVEAVTDADVIYGDVWTSMGQEAEKKERLKLFEGFQADKKLTSYAKNDYVYMHCLPAHRDEEVAAEVIDGPHSIVFDEAENRMHVQNAIMIDLMT